MFLEFYVFGKRVIGCVRGGGGGGGYENVISFEGGVLNIFRHLGGGCQILW